MISSVSSLQILPPYLQEGAEAAQVSDQNQENLNPQKKSEQDQTYFSEEIAKLLQAQNSLQAAPVVVPQEQNQSAAESSLQGMKIVQQNDETKTTSSLNAEKTLNHQLGEFQISGKENPLEFELAKLQTQTPIKNTITPEGSTQPMSMSSMLDTQSLKGQSELKNSASSLQAQLNASDSILQNSPDGEVLESQFFSATATQDPSWGEGVKNNKNLSPQGLQAVPQSATKVSGMQSGESSGKFFGSDDFVKTMQMSQMKPTPKKQDPQNTSFEFKLDSASTAPVPLQNQVANMLPPRIMNGVVTQGSLARARLDRLSVDQMGSEIVRVKDLGGGQMKIRLNPEELGEVQVTVKTVGNDVGLKIQTADPRAKSIIEDSMTYLRENLAKHNLAIRTMEVSVFSPTQQHTISGLTDPSSMMSQDSMMHQQSQSGFQNSSQQHHQYAEQHESAMSASSGRRGSSGSQGFSKSSGVASSPGLRTQPSGAGLGRLDVRG